MKKIIIVFSFIIGFILVLLIALFLFINSFLTPERATKFAQQTLSKSLKNMDVQIKRVYPVISFSGVSIKSQGIRIEKQEEILLLSKEISFSLKILPLIFKKIEIGKISIIKPEITLKIKQEKKKIPATQPSRGKIQKIPFFIVLKNFEVKEGKIAIIDKGEEKIFKPVNISFSSKAYREGLSFKGWLEIGFQKFREKILLKTEGSYNIWKDNLELSAFSIGTEEVHFKGKGNINNLLTDLSYSLLIRTDFPLSSLKKFLPSPDFIDLNGGLFVDLQIKGNKEEKIPYIKGEIKGKTLSIQQKESTIKIPNLFFKFKGKEVEIDANIEKEKTKIALKGSFELKEKFPFYIRIKGDGDLMAFTGRDEKFSISLNTKGNIDKGEIFGSFNAGKNSLDYNLNFSNEKKTTDIQGKIKSSYFNMNDFVKQEEKKEKSTKKQKSDFFLLPPNLSISISMDIGKFIFKKEILKNVHFLFRGDKNGFELKNFKGECYEGFLEGNIKIRKGTATFEPFIKAKGLRVEKFLENHPIPIGNLKGKLDIESSSRFLFEDPVGTLFSENALFVFQGTWEGFPILNKIAEVFQISAMKKLNFNKISASLKIENGWIDLKDFLFNSPDLTILPAGKVSLKGEVNIQAELIFKGKLLNGLKGSGIIPLNLFPHLNEIPVKIYLSGNYKNPDVKIDIRELTKEVKQELKEKVGKKVEKEKEKLKRSVEKEIEKLKKKIKFP